MKSSQQPRHQDCYEKHTEQQSGISIREILYRIFSRFYIFLACVIIVPMLAVYMVYLIPPQYEAKAKILIRHNDTSSFSDTNRSSSQQTNMSSQSIVEILTSLPVCERVVRDMNVKSEDIAKPSYKIIMGYMARVYYFFVPPDTSSDQTSPSDTQNSQLAKELEGAIYPQITDKGQAGFLRDDELIEVRLRSFNRLTVAGVTNKICEEFIAEYYKIFEDDAQRSYDLLSQQITLAESNFAGATIHISQDDLDKDVDTNPIVARTSRQIAEMEMKLSRLRTIYTNDSTELKQIRQEIIEAKHRLKTYKSQESTESILNSLKQRKRQAYMTLQVYQNKLIPISIIEQAIIPTKSSMLIMGRYLTAGGIGLATGVSLGFVLVMFLGAIDSRLFTPWDIEKISDIEIIGSIAEDTKTFSSTSVTDFTQLPISNTVMETLGMLDIKTTDNKNILLVTGPANNEGKTTISLHIACALAHDKRAKVLLLDANFSNQNLTRNLITAEDKPQGIIDVLTGEQDIDKVIQKTAFENLDFLPAGTVKHRNSAGFYRKSLRIALDSVRDEYDLIIVDTPGLLKSVDAAIFAAEANYILMVIKAGVTRRETFLNGEHLLNRADNKIIGTILNFRKHPVPRLFYGQE